MSLATFFIIACFAVGVQSARVQTLKSISEVKEVDAKVGEFVCGSILNKEAACYPKARSGWTSGKTTACTSKCTVEDKTGHFANMVGGQKCTCPNPGESCRSVNGENPGVLTSFISSVGGLTGPVKVEKATGNWQYLTKTDRWQGGIATGFQVTEWSWVYPDQTLLDSDHPFKESAGETGGSFMDHRNVMQDRSAGDICEPGAAGQYYLALQKMF